MPDAADRRHPWLVALAAAVAVAPALSGNGIKRGFYDDAFYYFQIARNVASGAGFSFDGSHFTNGFQPLWLAVLVPVFRFVPGDVAPLHVVHALQVVLLAAASTLLFSTLRQRIGAAAASVAALLVVTLPGSPALRGGMETPLLLLVLVAVWRHLLEWNRGPEPPSLRESLVLGSLLALAFLARVEAICLTPLALVWRARRGPLDRRTGLAVAGIPALVFGAYVAWNRLAFGEWLPISGRVKAYWWAQLSCGKKIGDLLDQEWIGGCAAQLVLGRAHLSECPPAARWIHGALLVLGAIALCRALAGQARVARVGFLLAASAALLLLDAAFVGLYPWHLLPVLILAGVAGGLGVAREPRLGAWALAAIGLVIGMRAVRGVAALRAAPADDSAVRAAQWLGRSTPGNARIGSFNAGVFGYFSHRQVTNLDGLVNDAAYFRTIYLERDIDGYLEREGIEWIVDDASSPGAKTPAALLDANGAHASSSRFELAAFFPDTSRPDQGATVWRRIR